MLSKNDPTESFTAFIKDFFELYDRFFPMKKYKSKRSNNLWISNGLKNHQKQKKVYMYTENLERIQVIKMNEIIKYM